MARTPSHILDKMDLTDYLNFLYLEANPKVLEELKQKQKNNEKGKQKNNEKGKQNDTRTI